MLTSFLVIAPVFALILAGWVAGKAKVFPENSVAILNNYVVYIAIPPLLFLFIADTDTAQIWRPAFSLVFAIVAFLLFAAVYITRRRQAGSIPGTMEALSASYGNTIYLGLPIGGAAFGAIGIAGAIISSLITSLVFTLSILLIELALHQGQRWTTSARHALLPTLLNPLVASPLLGALWMATGLDLATPVRTTANLLGASASPVALVTIGLFLATTPSGRPGRATWGIIVVKLLVMPLMVFGLVRLLDVPAPWGMVAVLFAAMPTGTGPFMLAQFYRTSPVVPAQTITLSTVLSGVTLALLINWFGGPVG